MKEISCQEESLFVEVGNQRLYSMLHFPEQGSPDSAIIFCHPFAEEKLWSHRAFVRFARELTELGLLVMRFDMHGYGDSDGEFSDMTWRQHVDDVGNMVNYLRERFPSLSNIGLLGLRLGATVALEAASKNPFVTRLVLWEPVLDGDRYMQETLRSNLAAQMLAMGQVEYTREDLIEDMKSGNAINVDGYPLNHRYFSDVSSIDLTDSDFDLKLNALIVQIVRNEKQPFNKTLEKFVQEFEGFELVKAEEMQFWKEIKEFYNSADKLFAVTRDWLGKE